MTKISQYDEISIATLDDLLIGTDVTAQNETKNFSIQQIIDLVPNSTYKVFTALLTQSGGDVQDDIISGLLVIGRTYEIGGSISGDDFRNVGGPLIVSDNDFNATYFVATGTTPTNYTNGTKLYFNTGAPVATILENTIGNIWFTYDSEGIYYCNSDYLFLNKKTYNTPYNFFSKDSLYENCVRTELTSESIITIYTIGIGLNDHDNGLINTAFEIRVYN
jgi:hypothetical protein